MCDIAEKAGGKIIEGDDGMSIASSRSHEVRADKSSSAGDQKSLAHGGRIRRAS